VFFHKKIFFSPDPVKQNFFKDNITGSPVKSLWDKISILAGSREQGAGSREQGAGSREQGAESREYGVWSRELSKSERG
jgi:hypothetical protein